MVPPPSEPFSVHATCFPAVSWFFPHSPTSPIPPGALPNPILLCCLWPQLTLAPGPPPHSSVCLCSHDIMSRCDLIASTAIQNTPSLFPRAADNFFFLFPNRDPPKTLPGHVATICFFAVSFDRLLFPFLHLLFFPIFFFLLRLSPLRSLYQLAFWLRTWSLPLRFVYPLFHIVFF